MGRFGAILRGWSFVKLQGLKASLRLCGCKPHVTVMGICTSSPPQRPDHLTRTATTTREQILSEATVVKICDLSPIVKGLHLQVKDKRLTFKAGQWVDMFIPGVETVGGFSMSSSPRQLREEGILELAVKFSKHPPAAWVHEKCQVGSVVSIKVGGDFYYHPIIMDSKMGDKESPVSENHPSPLLLLAGGVGINPLISILRHVSDITGSYGDKQPQARLLYTASTAENLIFKNELEELQRDYRNISCQFYVTKEKSDDSNVINGRIRKDDLSDAVIKLGQNSVICYICGPSSMIEAMENDLLHMGMSKNRIFYEKWW